MKKPSLVSFARLSFGNIIEWYDFSLYIYFSVYIAKDFFPSQNPYVSLLLTFATFFLGSVARPVGGLLVGWLSDRYHPKMMINLCVIAMGISTFIVALLPDYQTIGILAPIFLVTLRIIQGLSVGGQFPGLISLSVKDHHADKGFAVGLVFSISSLGFLLASVVGFVSSSLFSHQEAQFIWRVPFALSGLLFLIYLFLNRHESYPDVHKKKHKQNVFVWLVQQYKAIIAVTLLTTMAASLYYIVFTYLLNYQTTELNVSEQTAFLINSFSLIFACLLYPMFGQFADRIGAKQLFYTTATLFFISVIPMIYLIQTNEPMWVFLALTVFTLFMTAIQGAISPLFAEAFDSEWRTTGCAFAYSIGNGLSGAAPLVALTLVHIHPVYGLSVLMMVLLGLGAIGLALINNIQNSKT
ncbi:MFS transporter [Fastidiosibacter lacustris]|uniref:MFS transporter n=1 Tax=Fastidiosibacter lacustris TaxID=2056695 RepID=UPI000E356DF8|nr:MFS transporter [Fastidiosibacter lacustris]